MNNIQILGEAYLSSFILIDPDLNKFAKSSDLNILSGQIDMLLNMFQTLSFTSIDDISTIKLKTVGSPELISLEYAIDNYVFKPYTINEEIILFHGQKLYLRAIGKNENFSKDKSNRYQFEMTGKIVASGNIMSLLDKTGTRNDVPAFCFNQLFNGCSCLISAPELPAIELNDSCYLGMFLSCTMLRQVPKLSATKLAENCYKSMFNTCKSLTDVSMLELPANQLEPYCYSYMFGWCSEITAAPQLNASQLADNCYQLMFVDCTKLTQVQDILPAENLSACCYYGMFEGCSSLTKAPELPATELVYECYNRMFRNCDNLNYLKVGFSNWFEDVKGAEENIIPTHKWMENVNGDGIFDCPNDLEIKHDIDHIPAKWTLQV